MQDEMSAEGNLSLLRADENRQQGSGTNQDDTTNGGCEHEMCDVVQRHDDRRMGGGGEEDVVKGKPANRSIGDDKEIPMLRRGWEEKVTIHCSDDDTYEIEELVHIDGDKPGQNTLESIFSKYGDHLAVPGVSTMRIATWNANGLKTLRKLRIAIRLMQTAEIDLLLGDSDKAPKELGWTPKISFDNLIKKMVVYDIENYKP
jgi:hypothetical protein